METYDFDNGGQVGKLKTLLGIMNEHGMRSEQARNYLTRMIEEEPEDFEDKAVTFAALKWHFPQARTFEELLEYARREFGDGNEFTPQEVAGLDSYLSEMFGRDFEQDDYEKDGT